MDDWTLGVDLAGRYTAAVLLNPDLKVCGEWSGDFGDSQRHHTVPVSNAVQWLGDALQFSQRLMGGAVFLPAIWMEEVPTQGMSVKMVTTIRGAFLAYLSRYCAPGLVPSGTWQKWIGYSQGGVGGKTKKDRKLFAKEWAAKQGYTAPTRYMHGYAPVDLIGNVLAKQREDLTDAYCIARYGAVHELPTADFSSAGLSLGRILRPPI